MRNVVSSLRINNDSKTKLGLETILLWYGISEYTSVYKSYKYRKLIWCQGQTIRHTKFWVYAAFRLFFPK